MNHWHTHIFFGLFGLLMGMSLTFIGFADYGELHRMFIFADLRMLLVFAGAVGLSMVGYLIIARGAKLPRKPLHRGSIIGGLLFGLGWAMTGACPSIAVVQFGGGHLSALVTMAGIVAGVWSYRWAHARYFRWDTGACEV
ncbi:MAG: YeeE/YedE family protein [Gammaproteobacteria bacterium]|nr:YeeE/YedE family protein [Gammaproteobacteria bacterium]